MVLRFLDKKRIFPDIKKINNATIKDLIDYYSDSGAYNGGRLADACKIYEKMIKEDAVICLTLSGALTPTGIGGFINLLIKHGLIDFVISTGANLYHDIHFALDLPVHQGDFRVDDIELLKEKIEINEEDIGFDCIHYEASGGEEVFISLVDQEHDALVGYLRLRNVAVPHRYELLRQPCMIIRELKVLGRELSLGQRIRKGWQHRGYGKELIYEAERFCLEKFEKKQLFVLSGVGVKEYYRKLGFRDNDVYLCKQLP